MVNVTDVFQSHTSGKPPAKETPTIVFLSGFPDTSDSWDRLAPHFESSHHVIKLAMPDYESKNLRQFWGYSLKEMTDGIAAVIKPHFERGSTIHLVGHDWGAGICMGYLQSYSKTVSKFVLLDVAERKKLCPRSLSYMLYLAFLFLVSRLSDNLALLLFGLYPWALFGPCNHEMGGELETPNVSGLKGFMCYPYFQFFVYVFGKLLSGQGQQAIESVMSLPLSKKDDNVPTLFLFGEKKRFMFHDEAFLRKLETHGGKWKSFPNCGHWLHWQEPQAVADEIKIFL